MDIKVTDNNLDSFYGLMIQSIIPRPIAWVLTENENGTYNVAPFSFFTGISSEPPTLMISIGWKDDKVRKDTWVNIEKRNKFVVHIPPVSLSEQVVKSSAALDQNVSEVDFANLTLLNREGELPRIEGPKIAFSCQKYKIIEIGEEKQGLIIGLISSLWVDDSVVSKENSRLILDSKKIDPLLRLGGLEYAELGRVFKLKRPSV